MDLIDAVILKDINRVKTLLRNGADPNLTIEDGLTPLHFAAAYNAVNIASVLIAAGAKVNVKNDYDETPLDIARLSDYTELVNLLINYVGYR
ncbi:MAG: ankyrin repeat domain-containing protein [Coxiellaceae bacterium]|nr:MAG: ankyrin repeat domain-containing protein [Coxiellaceae bacterium]